MADTLRIAAVQVAELDAIRDRISEIEAANTALRNVVTELKDRLRLIETEALAARPLLDEEGHALLFPLRRESEFAIARATYAAAREANGDSASPLTNAQTRSKL